MDKFYMHHPLLIIDHNNVYTFSHFMLIDANVEMEFGEHIFVWSL
jgi:hypothetical protein